MTLRADHVAGAFFVGFGLLVIALSGDLPTGSLSMPGSGFLPKIVAGLTIFFGLVLALRANESKVFATLSWSDAKHAALVVAITAAAIALFEPLGFLTTNVLLIFALLADHRAAPAAAGHRLQPRRGRDHVHSVRLRAQDAARSRPVRILGSSWKPPFTASISASRLPCSQPTRGTRFSAAWSARSSACCRASGRLPASPSCCR